MSYDRYVLKKRRIQMGLTLQEVANKAGIDIKQYQRFESGDRELASASFATTVQVLKALDLDAEKYTAGEYEIKELISLKKYITQTINILYENELLLLETG